MMESFLGMLLGGVVIWLAQWGKSYELRSRLAAWQHWAGGDRPFRATSAMYDMELMRQVAQRNAAAPPTSLPKSCESCGRPATGWADDEKAGTLGWCGRHHPDSECEYGEARLAERDDWEIKTASPPTSGAGWRRGHADDPDHAMASAVPPSHENGIGSDDHQHPVSGATRVRRHGSLGHRTHARQRLRRRLHGGPALHGARTKEGGSMNTTTKEAEGATTITSAVPGTDEPITIDDIKRAVAELSRIPKLPTLPRIGPDDIERLRSAPPRPRLHGSHLLDHRKKRIRKKAEKRLRAVLAAEHTWSMRWLPPGYFLARGRLCAIDIGGRSFGARFSWVPALLEPRADIARWRVPWAWGGHGHETVYSAHTLHF